MTYTPNALNKYDTYTYNIQMYMIRPGSLNERELNLQSSDDTNSVLIADNSQEARYNISSLEITLKPGSNLVRNQIHTLVNMQITEPNGITWFNNIINASQTLGIENHLKAVYILVVEFIGRDLEGKSVRHQPVFYYSIIIKNIISSVDAGGSNYQIEAYNTSSVGYQHLSHVIQDQITVEASTVGEFVIDFTKKLEISGLRKLSLDPGRLFADIYEIEFVDDATDWLNWGFSDLTERERSIGIDTIDGDKLQIPINSGSLISDVIEMVLSLTQEYRSLQISGDETSRQSETIEEGPDGSLDRFPILSKVLTSVEYMDYDILRGDYHKRIKYVVKPFIYADLITGNEMYVNGIVDLNIQHRRVRKLFETGLLRKKYDYIYTGQNTEVLNFEIKFDNLYYVMSPLGSGHFGNPNELAPRVARDSSATPSRLANLRNLKREVVDSNISLERIRNEIRRPIEEGSFQLSTLYQQQSEITQENEILTNRLNDQINLYNDYPVLFQPVNSRPLSFESDVMNDADHAGPINNDGVGVFQFGGIKTRAETSGNLITINLSIRGDPYWLGRPSNFANTNSNLNTLPDAETVDYTLGNNMLYFQAYLPVADETAEGRRVPRPDYQITAIYSIRNIVNTFSGGRFEQQLDCYVDSGTNVQMIRDILENGDNEQRNGDSSTTPNPHHEDPAQLQEDAVSSINRIEGPI